MEPPGINYEAFAYYARLRRVKRFIDRHYDRPISLREVAQVAGLERKYFSAFFREKTGIRFTEWLARVRIGHAVDLLRENNYTITHVAHAVGFGDLRTFERAFRNCKGTTPQAFKKAVRPS